MSEVSIDVIRRVFDAQGHFVEIGPWADDTTMIELRTVPGKHSADWFGKLTISLTPAMAQAIGLALVAAVQEAAQ